MILFKSGAGIEPCYDGHTLANVREVAGDGLSAISIKQCHRHCHFTVDPANKELLISCTQGLQARNSFWNLHKPDLRKVKELECATSGSVTQLLRSHNPEHAAKPTIKRKLFKILESFVTTKSNKSSKTKLLRTETNSWPANICVLSTLTKNAGNNRDTDFVRAQDLSSTPSINKMPSVSSERIKSYHRGRKVIDSMFTNTTNHYKNIPSSSKELCYRPLNDFSKDKLFLGPSTSSQIESCQIFNTNESKYSSPLYDSPNLCLDRKISLTRISSIGKDDGSMGQGFEKNIESGKHITFQEISEIQRHEDICRENKISPQIKTMLENEHLDEIISYITSTSVVEDILELEKQSKFCGSSVVASKGFENSHGENINVNKNNSSIITINNDNVKVGSNINLDNSSVYYDENMSSNYSYWEDEDFNLDLSKNEPVMSNIYSNINVKNKKASALVPLHYFREFWKECAISYPEYLENDVTCDYSLGNNSLPGYFHWESIDDENILEEAENIMHAINKFLDINIGLTTQANTSITIVELDNVENTSKHIISDTHIPISCLNKQEYWGNMNINERITEMFLNTQTLAECSSNQSLYDSPPEEMTDMQFEKERDHFKFRTEDSNSLQNNPHSSFVTMATKTSENYNEETIAMTEHLIETHEESKSISYIKIYTQEKYNFPDPVESFNEMFGSSNSNLGSTCRSEYQSKTNIYKKTESGQDLQKAHTNRNENQSMLQSSNNFQINSSNVIPMHDAYQITNNSQQDCKIPCSSVKSLSSVGQVQTTKEKENNFKYKKNSQLVFSSQQLPINLTNPLHNTTYK